MQKYIKMPHGIEAEPMTRGAYNEFIGWTIPADEKPCDEGYKITRQDGTFSWEPKELFEANHKEFDENQLITVTVFETNCMNFGHAVEAMKNGYKVARKGWNGKGMFAVYQKGYPQGIPCNKQTAEAWGMNEGDLFICRPYLQLKCADGSHAMWSPSTSDCLAEDWCIVEQTIVPTQEKEGENIG